MKKKLLSLALALVMVLALLPAAAFAAEPTPVEIGNITLSDVVSTDKYETALDVFGADSSPTEYQFLYNLGMIGFWYDDVEEYGYSTFWCYIVPEDATISLHTTEENPRYDIYVYTLEEVDGPSASSRAWQAICIDGFDATLEEGESETDYSTTKEFIQGYDPEFDLLWIGTGADDFILVRFGDLSEPAAPQFTDLLPWCEKEAVWAAQNGITNGYGSNDKFAPGVDCTQVQILTFLWRAENKPASTATVFSDLAGDYASAANWAYEMQMIGDSFNPNAICTRAQAVSYIWQALGKKQPNQTASFSDVDAGAPYADAVSWAVEKGITNGYNGNANFAPGQECTRGEIVCFLYRAYNN